MDPLQSIAKIAASGMTAQTARLRVISENVANADSTGTTPGADPFRRKAGPRFSDGDHVIGDDCALRYIQPGDHALLEDILHIREPGGVGLVHRVG